MPPPATNQAQNQQLQLQQLQLLVIQLRQGGGLSQTIIDTLRQQMVAVQQMAAAMRAGTAPAGATQTAINGVMQSMLALVRSARVTTASAAPSAPIPIPFLTPLPRPLLPVDPNAPHPAATATTAAPTPAATVSTPVKPADPCACFTVALSPVVRQMQAIYLRMQTPVSSATQPTPAGAPASSESPGVPSGLWAQFTAGISQMLSGFQGLTRHSIDLAGLFVGVKNAAAKLAADFAGFGQSVLSGISNVWSMAAQGLAATFAPLAAVMQTVTSALSSLASRIAGMIPKGAARKVGAIGKAIGNVVGGAKKAGGAVLGGAATVAKGGAAAASGTVGMVIEAGKMAVDMVMAPIRQFQQAAGTVTGFVQALNPAAVEVFGQAMRDLTATIGVALEPVLKVMTGVVREFSATLYPIMQQLRPILAQIAQTIAGTLSVAINAFGSILQTLMPAFQFVADVMRASAPMLQAAIAVFSGLISGIAGLFSGPTKSAMEGFRTAVREMAGAILLATTATLSYVASQKFTNDFVKGMKAALLGEGVEKKSAVGLAAAQNATMGGLPDFIRAQMQKSLLAGPDGVKSKDEQDKEYWEQLFKTLEGMASDQKDIFDAAVDKVLVKIGVQSVAPFTAAAQAIGAAIPVTKFVSKFVLGSSM